MIIFPSPKTEEPLPRIDLNGQWLGTCHKDGEHFDFTATVPGCAHTDLMGVKLPDDPFYRDNADSCQWIETCDFEYTKTFSLQDLPKKAVLVFEGLDTYADIYVNDIPVGNTSNMFIEHRLDILSQLRQGDNTLRVYLHSPIKAVEGLPECKGAFTRERMHTRRIQCTYGWDWVARFVTCGIWKDVYIDCTTDFRAEHVYIYTEAIGKDNAQIVVEAEFENFENGEYAHLLITDPEGFVMVNHRWFVKEREFKEYFDLIEPSLWFPTGYGEQPLYTLTLCGKDYPFGIRTVRVLEEPNFPGDDYHALCMKLQDTPSGKAYDHNIWVSGFQLLVNNVPIMCKGANWVPSEPFPSAETDSKITNLLELGVEANLNMLRVWGGGIFERDHFYNECDRLGILVTQDFLMACGHYPEDDPEFIRQLQAETRHAALRLRNHPCLMWWSGDNENAVLGHDVSESYTGRTAIHQGIKPVLNRYDPRRRFFNSSPYGGNTYASKTLGTTHNTQFMGKSLFPYILNTDMKDYKEHFKEYLARFIAEEPSMGAICLPSLKRFMTDEDIYGNLAMWEYHTKSNPALKTSLFEILLQFTQKVLGEFKDGHDRYFKLKYAQYEWVRISMEEVRRHCGFCNGILYWMWNDCWPAAAGWSMIDYYGLPKAAYYSFKRGAGDLMLSLEKEKDRRGKDRYVFYLSNNSRKYKNTVLHYYGVSGSTLTRIGEYSHDLPPGYCSRVYSMVSDVVPKGNILVCDAVCKKERVRAFYKDGTLPLVPTDAVTVVCRDAESITLKASAYVHVVELEGQYIFEDNFFSLLPGEERSITFRKAAEDAAGIRVIGYTVDQPEIQQPEQTNEPHLVLVN